MHPSECRQRNSSTMALDVEADAPSCLFCHHDASTSTLHRSLHGHPSDGYYHAACFEAYCKSKGATDAEDPLPFPQGSGVSSGPDLVVCPICRSALEIEVRLRKARLPLKMAPLLTALFENRTAQLLEMLPAISASKHASEADKSTTEDSNARINLTTGQLLVLLQYALDKEDKQSSKEWADVVELLMELVYAPTPNEARTDEARDTEEHAGQAVSAEQAATDENAKCDDLTVDIVFAEKFCRVMQCNYMLQAFQHEQHQPAPTERRESNLTVAKKTDVLHRFKHWLTKNL